MNMMYGDQAPVIILLVAQSTISGLPSFGNTEKKKMFFFCPVGVFDFLAPITHLPVTLLHARLKHKNIESPEAVIFKEFPETTHLTFWQSKTGQNLYCKYDINFFPVFAKPSRR